MTRINCIPVKELTDKHLLAEYRELPRVFRLARAAPDAPKHYVLGAGHVKFFYNKLGYLFVRQNQLHAEMLQRGFKPNYTPQQLYHEWYPAKRQLWNFWLPTKAAQKLNRQRIKKRLKGKSK